MRKNASDVNWKNDNFDQFRTGLTYYEVWQILRQEKEAGKRRWVTRHTVLGRWHELKLSMYKALRDAYGFSGSDMEVPF